MRILTLLVALAFSSAVRAETVFKVDLGQDYQKYTQADLQRRVWELERAVLQLQQKVFALEIGKPAVADTWLCTVVAMGVTYTATGGSKAVATSAVIDKCRSGNEHAFFCKDPKCEQ